ncbi:phage tail protein [Streptomyces sp. LNU-CPARS28]|uniref:phage tail protein n=1 Tax=Streptomyces sp. LNU-CPARS28 TaxID=3137371 RepID=UPI003135CCAC
MALTIGELVGFIDLDDSGARRGVASAEGALRDLQRGTDGRLRDIRGRFVAESAAMGAALGDGVGDGSERASGRLALVGKAVAGIGVGLPAVAAVGVAVGALAAAAASAQVAVKAFTLAAGPQLEQVTSAYELYTAAQEAAAKGGAQAAAAQQAYRDALAEMPPATRATAQSFIGLKEDVKSWSDSLSSTTMPVFTKGIELLRDLLPTLTPFVKGAAAAFGGFLDEVRAGVESAPFKRFAADMGEAAGPNLANFLDVLKNVAVGFAGILSAFLPVSTGMSGGLADLSARFAEFGQNLGSSDGFEEFLDLARSGAQTLGNLGGAFVDLLVALAPLLGTTALLVSAFAEVISAVPTPVLTALATVIAVVTIAIKAWTLAQTISAAATRAWAVVQTAWNAVMAANPILLVVGLIALLVAGVILAYQKSETFRQIVQAAWDGIKAAASLAWELLKAAFDGIVAAAGWVIDFVRANWPLLLAILTGPIGVAVLLIVKYWDKIKSGFSAAWSAVRKLGSDAVSWVAGLPGRIISALSSLGSKLWSTATAAFRRFKDGSAQIALSAVEWVRGLPGRIVKAIGSLGSLLLDKGKDIVRGLWNGIKAMGGWIKDKLIGWAKDMIPGPIADALGISSPSRVMAKDVGRWIPAGLVRGIESGQGAVDRTMRRLVTPPTVPALPQFAGAPYGDIGAGFGSTPGGASVHIEHWHGGEQSPEQNATALAWHMKQRG